MAQNLIDQGTDECERALRRIGAAPHVVETAVRGVTLSASIGSAADQQQRFEAATAMTILTRLSANGGDGAADLLTQNPSWLSYLQDTPPDAADVRAWWTGLDPSVTTALVAGVPLLVGNLDGVRLADRFSANRANITNAIAAEQATIAALQQRLADLRGRPRSAASPRIRSQIAAAQERIDAWQALLDSSYVVHDRHNVRQSVAAEVAVFDPARHAIATYHGPIDPDTGDIPAWIKHVAVSVPGTGANMVDWSDDRARDIYAAGVANQTAVFQWAGGSFPQSIPQAMDSSFSHELAPRLASFTNSIAVPTAADLTVLGHSYGGATVGLAEAAGLKADRVLYVAAAGLGNGNTGLGDFPHTSDVPHYAIMARNDGVVGAIQGPLTERMHGPSTLRTEGVIRLETGQIDASDPDSAWIESYNTPGNWSPPTFDAHSTVFTVGSTSFDNIMAVITGGEAQVFAPDVTMVLSDGSIVTLPGHLADDYAPQYIGVE